MQRLIEGLHKFQNDELGQYQDLFHRLSVEGQNPHTLFITCSDSRVLAELITQSQPGDLFVVKNMGNIVPPADPRYRNSTAAAIEFAVNTLEVKDIVVCGHSQCGAMQALLEGLPNEGKDQPHLQQWLEVVGPVKKLIQQNYSHLADRDLLATAAAQENVLYALENLHTYPVVVERLAAGKLRLHGWFFKIATAQIFAYDAVSQQFLSIK